MYRLLSFKLNDSIKLYSSISDGDGGGQWCESIYIHMLVYSLHSIYDVSPTKNAINALVGGGGGSVRVPYRIRTTQLVL